MAAIATFSDSFVEQVGRTLDASASHNQLTDIFQELGIYEYDAGGSKWSRIKSSLIGRQRQDRAGDIVLIFIEHTLNPIRFLNCKEHFTELCESINVLLSFSGYFVQDNGKLSTTEIVHTLSEAEKRAKRLKSLLIERKTHPDILKFCNAELLEENYFHSLLEATKSLAEKTRTKSGLTSDGVNLIDEAFSLKRPILAFNSLTYDYEKSEQSGLSNLMKGVFGTFRNPTAHAPRVAWKVKEQDALDFFATLSYLHRRVDESVPTGLKEVT